MGDAQGKKCARARSGQARQAHHHHHTTDAHVRAAAKQAREKERKRERKRERKHARHVSQGGGVEGRQRAGQAGTGREEESVARLLLPKCKGQGGRAKGERESA